jgi:hypothetical protein
VHDLHSLVEPPYIFLIVGGVFLSAAVFWMYTGRAWVRFNGWVYRAKEPKWFWWQVAVCLLFGIGFIARFLYGVLGSAN